ncbi:MFS transporter [bacterium]|nr:MFS transporter [bacterium]
MLRYLVLICAVVMQMCLGATYSWSVYVQRLKVLTGLGQGLVQLPFTLFYFLFPATMVIVGGLLFRIGVRRSAVIGGVIFGGGWIFAGFGQIHFLFTIIGIGVMAGIGVGFAYMVPIAVAIQWFPDHKGLVTGIAVAGFGGGAALVSQVSALLMASYQFSPFQTFRIMGLIFLLLVSTAGLFMALPTGHSFVSNPPLRIKGLVTDRTFILLYLCMVTALAAGFTVNANLKELLGVDLPKVGVLAVSLFAVANAGGRLVWGAFSDRVRSRPAIGFNLLSQAGLMIIAFWILDSVPGFLVFAFIAGFNYGGVLVIYASTVARKWGSDKVGQVYGLLFSANIPAAIAPLLAGFLYDRIGSFTLSLWFLAGCMILVFLVTGKLFQDNKEI